MDCNFKKVSTFLAVVLGWSIIFELPYIRNSFYIPICQALNLTNKEFGGLSSIYSCVCVIVYFFGGILSDRIHSRWILLLPFVGTGILGFWFSSFPDYEELKIIFALMGVTTVMTFFSTAIRILKCLGNRYEQGRIFGLTEAGKGAFAGLTFLVIQIMFRALGGSRFGFEWVIKSYSILNVIVGIGLVLIVPDEYLYVSQTMTLKQELKKVISDYRVWSMGLIVFLSYSMYTFLSFIPSFFLKVYGLSLETSQSISIWRYGMQVVGAILAGCLADKVKSSYKMLFGSFVIILLSLLNFLTQLHAVPSLIMGVIGFGIFSITVYGGKALYYTMLSENSIDEACIGGTVGLIAAIGYLPDTFMYSIVGNWIDLGGKGYYKMFTYAIILTLIGVLVTGMTLHGMKRKRRICETDRRE